MHAIVQVQADLNASPHQADHDRMPTHPTRPADGSDLDVLVPLVPLVPPVPPVPIAPLIPIEQAARRFGLRASALRYYEERGLLAPAAHHSGRRWYGPPELRRIAVIRYWQRSALLSLDEIGELLADPGTPGTSGASGTAGASETAGAAETVARPWPQVAQDRIAAMRARITALEQACALLEHTLEHHPDGSPDGCPYYEDEVWADTADVARP
jgi:DNA-binding transcriptional MerR regulator